MDRGLQIRCSDGSFGPHTKYWPLFRERVASARDSEIPDLASEDLLTLRVATADDDIIYPEWWLERLLECADVSLAPKADDIWLHACAVRSGTKVRQVFGQQRNFAVVPTTQFNAALVVRNVWMGGNDVQASRVYTDDDIAALKQATSAL